MAPAPIMPLASSVASSGQEKLAISVRNTFLHVPEGQLEPLAERRRSSRARTEPTIRSEETTEDEQEEAEASTPSQADGELSAEHSCDEAGDEDTQPTVCQCVTYNPFDSPGAPNLLVTRRREFGRRDRGDKESETNTPAMRVRFDTNDPFEIEMSPREADATTPATRVRFDTFDPFESPIPEVEAPPSGLASASAAAATAGLMPMTVPASTASPLIAPVVASTPAPAMVPLAIQQPWPALAPAPDARVASAPQRATDVPSAPVADTSSVPQRTTVMLRNFPNNYTRAMVLDLLNTRGFSGKYDFLYFPIDFRTHAALGYAFVNLVSPEAAQALHDSFDGFTQWMLPSNKVCNAGWSHPHQGLEAHVGRYRNSPLMHDCVPDEYRPVLFLNGIRVPFPPPTKRVKPPRQGTQRMLV